MKIGDNIKEIREVERNFKRSYVAKRLKITTRAYCNIENNITDISVTRLEEIANILGCSPQYILSYKQAKSDFYNFFHNHEGNRGVNIMNQGGHDIGLEKIQRLQQELLESERQRIILLEAILKNNNIHF